MNREPKADADRLIDEHLREWYNDKVKVSPAILAYKLRLLTKKSINLDMINKRLRQLLLKPLSNPRRKVDYY